MVKSAAKLMGIALLMMAVGAPLAKATDDMKGTTATVAIAVSIILCIAGAATFLYGLVKLIAGLVKRK